MGIWHPSSTWVLKNKNKGLFYRRVLKFALLFTCIPIIITSLAIFFMGKHNVEQQIIQSNRAQIRLANEKIDMALNGLENMAEQWALSELLNNNIAKLYKLHESPKEIHDLYNTVNIIQDASPLIDQVVIYLGKPDTIIDSEGIILWCDQDVLYRYRSLMRKNEWFFWEDSLEGVRENENTPSLALVKSLKNSIGMVYGVMVLYLDESNLNKMLNEFTFSKGNIAFFLSKDGQWLSSRPGEANTLSPFFSCLQKDVAARLAKTPSDYYTCNFGKDTYSVYYGRFSRNGLDLVYVIAKPFGQIIQPVKIITIVTFTAGLVALAVASVVAMAVSHKFYTPIASLLESIGTQASDVESQPKDEIKYIETQWNRLTNESEFLKDRLDNALQSLKEGFLLKLFLGHHYSSTEESLIERMEQFGWNVRQKNFTVILYQLFGLSNPECDFIKGDEQLLTFAAHNVINELTEEIDGKIDAVILQEMEIGLLLAYPKEKTAQQVKDELYRSCKEIMDIVFSVLGVNVVVSIGKLSSTIKDISTIAEEARRAFAYRDLHEGNQIIDVDEFLPKTSGVDYYPFEIEKAIIQNMRLGDKAAALSALAQMVQCLVKDSKKEVHLQQGILQLLGIILHTEMEMGFNPNSIYSGDNLYDKVTMLRTQDEIIKWFELVVLIPYFNEFEQTQNRHFNHMVEKTIEVINKEYADTNLSLEYCADLLCIKPYTLSKAFKHVTGINFIDYLTKFRMEKAKELLCKSDMKINDIADKVGYQTSYMFRIFKKYEGMTPGQYREKFRK